MSPTWETTQWYWKRDAHQAVQRALRCSAQQRNSNEYWNDLQTGAGLYRSALIDTRLKFCRNFADNLEDVEFF